MGSLETAAVDFGGDHAPAFARIPGKQPQLHALVAVPQIEGNLHHPVTSIQLNREHAHESYMI